MAKLENLLLITVVKNKKVFTEKTVCALYCAMFHIQYIITVLA